MTVYAVVIDYTINRPHVALDDPNCRCAQILDIDLTTETYIDFNQ